MDLMTNEKSLKIIWLLNEVKITNKEQKNVYNIKIYS